MIPAAVTSEAEQILFGGLMLFEVAIIGKEEYKYLVLLFIRKWFYIYRAYVLVFLKYLYQFQDFKNSFICILCLPIPQLLLLLFIICNEFCKDCKAKSFISVETCLF